MKYTQSLSRLIRKGRNKLVGNDLVSTEQAILFEIRQLRDGLPNVVGILVATADGMLITHDLGNGQPETLAAMSAAQLGLAQQIAAAVRRGTFQETITRAEHGYVATFAAGDTALLTVVANPDLNIGLLHHEARPVAARIGEIVRPADRSPTHGAPAHRSPTHGPFSNPRNHTNRGQE